MNVLDMILDIQAKAKKQGGVLKDLALPQELYDQLLEELKTVLKYTDWGYDKDKLYIAGSLIHTGEED